MDLVLDSLAALALLGVGFTLGYIFARARARADAPRWRELYEAERARVEQLEKRRSGQ